ncbi:MULTISPECIES: tetratricopeptide repeat protein [Cylindrospermopsis]|jgi:tetratricopeptide (TPR) repeat protein|uniref:Tetratricopeptide repeat protein n=1 Tax=Cylindrospermopsis curvispora GIHE-G1 TaxID=2666332 RepID=A0A7H0EZK3_9CYAN|nr:MULTISPECIES: tetratricopeptide repeat protein [Cylindrospermopsis]MBU6346651.1 hypothetical protein [Cyanobacteria bacterium REEB494]QNP29219.1 hypothetical protein IAR63_15485 [Cylindrospermopsis curvispora GIHE-G1]UJS05366.1 hypothetical protein L3I90_03720 [Cylindrospermopsis raciborskii KLL07]
MNIKRLVSVGMIVATIGINSKAFAQNQEYGTQRVSEIPNAFPEFTIPRNIKLVECFNNLNFDSDKATLRYLNRTLKGSPNNPCLYLARGLTYMNLGRIQAAKTDFDTFIGMDSNFPYVYVFRGFCFMLLNSPVTAISDLRKASGLFEAQGNLSFMELLNGLIKNLELLSNP